MFPKLLFICLLGTIPVAAFAAVESFEGKVVKVIDGDTLQILDNQNSNIRVRLYGIDAPERNSRGDRRRSRHSAVP